MDQALSRKWRDALEGKGYEQGKIALCEQGTQEDAPKKWCCLGVLMDIINPEGWDRQNGFYPERLTHPMKREGGEYLSDKALEEVGMSMEEQKVFGQLNDDGVSFEIISHTVAAFYGGQSLWGPNPES